MDSRTSSGFPREYHLCRHDGIYRWMFDIASPRINGNGSFAGLIGSGIDILVVSDAGAAFDSGADPLQKVEFDKNGQSGAQPAESTALRPISRSAGPVSVFKQLNVGPINPVESMLIRRLICNCTKTTIAVRFSYHADQSFHKGTSRSSRAASPPPRYPPGRSTGREHRGWTNCIDAAQETPPSNKTRD